MRSWSPEDLEEFEERAAIRTYLGKQPIQEAEKGAWDDVTSRRVTDCVTLECELQIDRLDRDGRARAGVELKEQERARAMASRRPERDRQ